MKRIIILSLVTGMLLSGCGIRISMADGIRDMESKSSVGIFHVQSSFFERYSIDQDEDHCKVKGTLHQATDDDYGVITYITAEDGGGSVSVTGSIKCTRGNLRLVYTAPDGTETLIAEGTDRKIDAQVVVAEGEGNISFASDGESAVCDFGIKMETGDGVTFANIMEHDSIEEIEDMEIPEILDTSEPPEEHGKPEIPETPEPPEECEISEIPEGIEKSGDMENIEMDRDHIDKDLENIGLDEIENDWPEGIRYHSNGSSANPMSTRFEVDAPMTVTVSCATREGELRLKIVRHSVLGEIGEAVYLDETNPDGEYTVELDKKGQYKVLFYAKEHVGSVEIIPENE